MEETNMKPWHDLMQGMYISHPGFDIGGAALCADCSASCAQILQGSSYLKKKKKKKVYSVHMSLIVCHSALHITKGFNAYT